MKGQLSQQSFGEVLSELYRTRANGILTVTHDKQTKAIFIEDGSPVFALSNVAEDQLSDYLVRTGKLTSEQISQFGSGANVQQLSQKLAESGLISVQELDEALQRINIHAILSIFDWYSANFSFEKKDRARIAMSGKISKPVSHLILEGVRNIQDELILKVPLSNPNLTLKLAPNNQEILAGAQLSAEETQVLFSLSDSTPIQQIIAICGLPELQALQAIHALYVTGILQSTTAPPPTNNIVTETTKPTPTSTSKPTPTSTSTPKTESKASDDDEVKFQQEVTRMLAFFASADLYEILGVTRKASESDIKKAYYQLAKKYHPDRVHKTSSPDLKTAVEKVFAKISEAYEKLKDAETRKRYDTQIGSKASSNPPAKVPTQTPKPTPASTPVPTPTPAPTNNTPRPSTAAAPNSAPANQRPTSAPQTTPAPVASAPSTASAPAQSPRPVSPSPTPVAASQPAARPVTSQPAQPTAAAAAPKIEAGKTGAVSPNKDDKGPNSAEIIFNKGQQALKAQDIARAAYLFREAVNLSPDNKDYKLQLIQILLKNQKWHKEAEEILLDLAKKDSTNANYLAMLGSIYKAAELDAKAKAKFEEALSYDPSNKLARREMADLKAQGRDIAEAPKPAGLAGQWAALPQNTQYAVIGGGILLVILILYYTVLKPAPPPPAKPTPTPTAKAAK